MVTQITCSLSIINASSHAMENYLEMNRLDLKKKYVIPVSRPTNPLILVPTQKFLLLIQNYPSPCVIMCCSPHRFAVRLQHITTRAWQMLNPLNKTKEVLPLVSEIHTFEVNVKFEQF